MFGFDLGLHSRFPVSVPRAPHNFNPSSVLWPEDAPQYRDSQPYSSSWASVSSPRLQRTNSWHGSISAPLDPTDPDLSNPKSFGARQSMPRHQRPHSWSAIDAPKWWLNDANPYLTNTPTTPIQIHPWLNGDAPSSGFYFDLAPGQFCPIRIVSTTLSTALGPELSEPAFYPPLTKLRILHPCIPYWPVDLNPSPIRLGDVLVALHRALQLRITHTDWETLSEEDKHAVARAWKQRYHAEAGRSGVPPAHLRDREEAEKNQGVKRVDFLQGKTVFRGLVRAPGDPDGCVRLLTAPARYDLPPLKPLLLG
ncbi:hypothetical protein FB451DRAFT_449185 [Mycena latifolia]|nr:hypothetical protein FB451DRAFT_449185 [Mycena latifolia]